MSSTIEDLPPEIRDRKSMIEDGVIDEMEALEELADDEERAEAPGGIPKDPADQAEPAPETL
ncbi:MULTISPECIES: hypothetical protein [unclassified Aureimonas]|uniref:hypothetical protein n=1 Tax=unclassified Aureimonas TaxID=2615206 RepID=UPI0006FE42BE|nr:MULTISPECIES: hypothetical protein [unclassified Aureimonas]KQT52753.1 hypothetical protein ASG62_12530 [Aureimonas sp. Leaf427]KQT80213.1 hypothetical protein ASG54_06380 [Aureimonas sp. Leaf460]